MIKQYRYKGLQWQFEESEAPAGAVEIKAEQPKNKAKKPANKARKAVNDK